MEENAQPLVSIGIPVYGVAKWIERCARSLFEQTYQNIEYVFVDDCSPDNSIEILQNVITRYPDRQKHIKIIRHNVNKGLASARNTFLDNMTGSFCIHVDSDDYVEKTYVEEMVKAQRTNDADIVFSDYYIETKNGRETKKRVVDEDKEKYLLDILGFKKPHYVWGMMARASLYKGNNIHPVESVNVGEDFQVLPQLLYYAKNIAKVNEPLYAYNRLNENSYTSFFTEKVGRHDLATFDILRNVFQDKEIKYVNTINRAEAHYLHSHLIRYDKKMGNEFKNEMIHRFKRLDSCAKRNIRSLDRFLLQENMLVVLDTYIKIKTKLCKILRRIK